VIVERLMHLQLRAMECERFELGIRREAGEMILREWRAPLTSKRQSSGFATKMRRVPTFACDPQTPRAKPALNGTVEA